MRTVFGVSERRACRVIRIARSSQRYRKRKSVTEPPLTRRVVELATQFGRYGYRRITALLRREGWCVNHKRVERLWRQEGLQVPKKRPRRRVATSRPRPQTPTGVNHVWAYDFVFDTCADGRTLKCLTVIDEFTRDCLAIDLAAAFDRRVIDVLAQLVSVH